MRQYAVIGFSDWNYQLMDADSEPQDQNARKIPRTGTIPGSATVNALSSKYKCMTNFKSI
jgi:hypothetical protein